MQTNEAISLLKRTNNFSHSDYLKLYYSKTCVKRPLSKDQKLVFMSNCRLMQVKSMFCLHILQREHSAILSTFIKLPFAIKTFVLSILSGRFTKILLHLKT